MRRWIYATLLFLLFGLLVFSCVKDNIISATTQFKLDTNSIHNFLKTEGIIAQKAPGGFWYSIDNLDTGVLPVLTDSVRISFKAYVIPNINGHAVDSSASHSDSIALTNSIAGIQQGLQLFPVGSSGRLYIPSGLAFGSIPYGNIPANSNLYYTIKLVSVKGTQLTNDISTIVSYLAANVITAQVDRGSGIHYVIDTLGKTTIKPQLTDSIHVIYNWRTLGATTPIKSADSVLALNSQIAGLKIVLSKITQGSHVTIYIPSGYAFGNIASTTIPSNSNLVYHVTLDSVIHH